MYIHMSSLLSPKYLIIMQLYVHMHECKDVHISFSNVDKHISVHTGYQWD